MILLTSVLLAFSVPAELPWKTDAPTPATVERLPDGELRVVSPTAGSRTLLAELADPNLPHHRFVLKSRLAYRGVAPAGHLEMLTRTVRDEYFSRTLDASGPLGKLAGDSAGREVELPFVADPNEMPNRIQVWLSLPGAGAVTLRPFVIDEWRMSSRTWIATGGMSAGVGMTIGLLGGVFGLLFAIPEARGRARPYAVAMLALGVVSMFVGGALGFAGQAFGLWFPLAAGGGLLAAVFALAFLLVPNSTAAPLVSVGDSS